MTFVEREEGRDAMSTSVGEVARFEDRYGEERVIHKTPAGLRVKQVTKTPALRMNRAVSLMIGQRIKHYRTQRGWELQELAIRAGMAGGHPKNRMWEIENSIRGQGVRMGTVYALAAALGVEASDLMPSVAEVLAEADVQQIPMTATETLV